MGGKITRPAEADLARAKLLKQALENGAPTLHVSGDASSQGPSLDSPTASHPAYIEQLVQCAPEAICVVDAEFRVLRLNAEFTSVFGFAQEDIAGKKIDSVVFPPGRESEFQWVKEVLARGQKANLETKRLCKDGSWIDVFASMAPLIVGGERIATYGLYRDISAQKRRRQ